MNLLTFLPGARFEAQGLHFRFTDRADDGVLDDFFPAYDRAFVLENEKERVEGFHACLALNDGAAHRTLRERYGPFRELIATARNEPDGPVIGGANLLVTQLPAMPELPGLPDLAGAAAASIGHSLNLNYLFVDPRQRGRGLGGCIQRACFEVAANLSREWGGKRHGGVAFLEVNDPFRLTPEAYRLDTAHAGIDQVARLGYWARAGARVLDWPYVQPALSDTQGDDDTLAMAVIGATAAALPAGLLAHHLERFFAISVLKGQPLADSPSATAQLAELAARHRAGASIGLLDLARHLPNLARVLRGAGRGRPGNLPEALKNGDRP